MTQKFTITEAEACRSLKVSRTSLWRLRRAGKISYYRVATKVLYSVEHIEEFLASCERRSRSKAAKPDQVGVTKR